MELTEVAKAVVMYNTLYSHSPITDDQAQHFLQIWGMVNGKVESSPPPPPTDPVVNPQSEPATLPKPKEVAPPILKIADPKFKAIAGEYIPARPPEFLESVSNIWPHGYAYRINVSPKRDCFISQHESPVFYYFTEKPTQEQFDEHYGKFLARTHNVHVHYRQRGEGYGCSRTLTITDEYCSWRHRDIGCFGDMFDTDPDWREEDARFRIKYKNLNNIAKGDFRYVYFENKPTVDTVSEYQRKHSVALLEHIDQVKGRH